ncbi:MAG: hypothetical protein NT124_04445 [Candidatus Dependentiae bacterium]|nr:hypothetical protein [Candidatus Dependentiae bacterium]
MYFIPRTNAFYSWAIQLNVIYRFFVTSISISALWFFWFYVLYSKNDFFIERYRTDIASLHAQGVQTSCIEQECATAQNAIDEFHDFVHPYCAPLSEKVITQSRMIEIIKYIKKSGLYLTGCTAGKCLDKGWYIKHIVHVDVTGTMDSIQQFFSHIKASKKMIQCSHVRIDRRDDALFHLTADMHSICLKDKKIPST